MRRLLPCLIVLIALPAAAEDRSLTRVAFASCADQDRPLPILDRIVALKPDLYLAMGDNIYADLKPEPGLDEVASMKAKYDRLATLPGWQKLVATCPVLATWDDHDYGKNDQGVDYPHKVESQRLFCDFFKVPADAPLRSQKGVYQSKTFGPPGKRVQVILLDGRYHRSPLKKAATVLPGTRIRPYLPVTDPAATLLGAEQWKWLEEQLKQPAELRLLVSGIQVISEDHPHEKWMNIPAERDRLYKLIRDTKAAGVVILSGDRHMAEISLDRKAVGYPLFDVTSSGLNQGSKVWRPAEVNRHLVAAMPHGDNFGLLTIDWAAEGSPRISMQVRDADGEVAIRETIPLSLLQPGPAVADLPHKPGEGAISPRDALKKVGEKVMIEMTVQGTGQAKNGTRIFLNSEKDYRSELNFTVVVNAAALKGKWAKATPDTFKGKVIRVTGTVSKFRDNPQVEVNDEGQIQVVE